LGIDSKQLREEIVQPTLRFLDLGNDDSAEELLLGTASQESHMGTYLKQLGGGPALGIFQMEPATFQDLWDNVINHREELREKVCDFEKYNFASNSMVYNLKFACAMARVQYWRWPEKLPEPDDIEGLAKYWKKYYNSIEGKGTVAEFILNYKKFVK